MWLKAFISLFLLFFTLNLFLLCSIPRYIFNAAVMFPLRFIYLLYEFFRGKEPGFEHIIIQDDTTVKKRGYIRPSKPLYNFIRKHYQKENVSDNLFLIFTIIFVYRKSIFILILLFYRCWFHPDHGFLLMLVDIC